MPSACRPLLPRRSRSRPRASGCVSWLPLDARQRRRCHDVAALCADFDTRDLLAEGGRVHGAVDLDFGSEEGSRADLLAGLVVDDD
ncbi:hypothetical protein ACFPRL_10255 [Pseudoclavibacter helvolus]